MLGERRRQPSATLLLLALITVFVANAAPTSLDTVPEYVYDPKVADVLSDLTTHIPSSPVSSLDPPPPADDPCDVQCWLESLIITIPPLSIDKDGIEATIDDFVCQHIQFGGIGSNMAPNDTGIFVGVYDIGVSCAGSFTYSVLKVFKGKGTVKFDIVKTTLGFGIELLPGTDHLINSTEFYNCSMYLNVENLKFTGGLASDVANLFSKEIEKQVHDKVPPLICGELQSLVLTNLTEVIGAINAKVRPYLNPNVSVGTPVVPPSMRGDIANFRGLPVMGLFHYLLDTLVGANGTLGLNKLINYATNGTGRFILPPELIAKINPPPIYVPSLAADLQFGIKAFDISGLNEWEEFALFEEISNQTINSHTLLQSVDASLVFFVNVSFNNSVKSPVLQGKYLYEEGNITVAITDADLHSTLLLWLNGTGINELQGTQFADIGCLMGQVYTANMTNLRLNLTLNQFTVSDVGTDRGPVGKEIDGMINNVISIFTRAYARVIPVGINGLVATTVSQAVNSAIASALAQPNTTMCAAPTPMKQLSDPTTNLHIIVVASGVWFALCVIVITLHVCHRVKRKAYRDAKMHLLVNYGGVAAASTPLRGRTSSGQSASTLGGGKDGEHHHHNRPYDLAAMVTHRKLGWLVRLGIPLLIIGNIALFLSSNLSEGAGVVPVLSTGDKTIQLPSVFYFSLTSTVKNMWIAGVYPLCILVAVFSGGWPYLKLFLMLMCWIVPTRLLKPRRREQVLEVIDALGKWSLIDSYVMILMLVAFRLTINAPADEATDTPSGASKVDIFVLPFTGFYTFLAATMLSLALSNVILNMHRWTEDPTTGKPKTRPHVTGSATVGGGDRIVTSTMVSGTGGVAIGAGPTGNAAISYPAHDYGNSVANDPDVRAAYDAPAEALSHHHFGPKRLQGRKIQFNVFGRLLLAISLVLSLLLMCVGIYIQSFNFEFKGAAGFVLEFLHEATSTSYSVLSLGMAVPSASQTPDSLGIRYIQSMFFVFTIAVPLLHMLSVLLVWVVPLRPRWQDSLFKLTEILLGWAALEVMIVSVIVALLEIQQFAQFTIKDACGAINKILAANFSTLLDGDPRCFDVIARLQAGCWILFAAGLIYLIVAQAIMRMCHAALVSRRTKQKAVATRKRRLSRDLAAHDNVYNAVLSDEEGSETSESSEEGRVPTPRDKPLSFTARVLLAMPFLSVVEAEDGHGGKGLYRA